LILKSGRFCETLKDGMVRHMTVVYADSKTLRLWGRAWPPSERRGLLATLLSTWLRITAGGTKLVLTYDVGGYAKDGLGTTWAGPVDEVLGLQVRRLAS